MTIMSTSATSCITKQSFGALVVLLLLMAPAHATREPRPIIIDHRVRTILYQPDQVYKYTGHYHYQSSIEFAPDESILTISMGDSTAWMMNPSGFRLFLKPIEQDATTNMTIITNKRTYLFELHARETDDIDDKEMTFIMRFLYPNETSGVSGGGYRRGSSDDGGQSASFSRYLDSVPDPLSDLGKFNLNYTISGTDLIAPIRIFDDGEFTYFQFRNKNADLPAFYMVDEKGNEALINFRTRGDYVVVERVAKQFTLRHGNITACVFNETWTPLGNLPPEDPNIRPGKYNSTNASPLSLPTANTPIAAPARNARSNDGALAGTENQEFNDNTFPGQSGGSQQNGRAQQNRRAQPVVRINNRRGQN